MNIYVAILIILVLLLVAYREPFVNALRSQTTDAICLARCRESRKLWWEYADLISDLTRAIRRRDTFGIRSVVTQIASNRNMITQLAPESYRRKLYEILVENTQILMSLIGIYGGKQQDLENRWIENWIRIRSLIGNDRDSFGTPGFARSIIFDIREILGIANPGRDWLSRRADTAPRIADRIANCGCERFPQ